MELFQFADTPEQAFELLRQGLVENHLAPEAAAAGIPMNQELMPGWSIEDFLGPELAKTSR
jgi:hypothetical protein